MKKFKEDDQKFRELILYISQRCADQSTFGSVKLNKILYYSDFLTYAHTGRPITGHEYQKLKNGPAPKKLVPIRDKMITDGSLGLQPVPVEGGYIQKRPINLREPKLSAFTAEEIAMVDFVIATLKDADGETASRFTHQQIGWIAAREGETIPYASILLSNEPPTDAEVQRGREIAARFNALA